MNSAISTDQESSSAGYSQTSSVGRPHPGQHAIPGQPLEAVAAAEPINLQFAAAAEELPGECVLPFRAAGMQEGYLVCWRSQQQEAVVLHRHVPEKRVREAFDARELAEEPARQVDQMHPLVEQFATARAQRLRAPFALVAESSPMPVAGPQVHQFAQRAGIHQAARLPKCAVIAMIEPDAYAHVVPLGKQHKVLYLIAPARGGFFDQYMPPGLDGRARDGGERIVRGGNHDCVDISPDQASLASLSPALATRMRGRHTLGARQVGIHAVSQAGTREVRCARRCPMRPQPTMARFNAAFPTPDCDPPGVTRAQGVDIRGAQFFDPAGSSSQGSPKWR